MSDTDHARPNRAEIQAELAEMKRERDDLRERVAGLEHNIDVTNVMIVEARDERDEANARAEEAERHDAGTEALLRNEEKLSAEYRTRADAAEKRAEEAEAHFRNVVELGDEDAAVRRKLEDHRGRLAEAAGGLARLRIVVGRVVVQADMEPHQGRRPLHHPTRTGAVRGTGDHEKALQRGSP